MECSRPMATKVLSEVGRELVADAVLRQADVDAAYEFGMHLGLAFQYVDDVLDFTGTEEGMGKDSLADLGVRLTGIAAHTRTRARTPLAFGHPFHVCASAHASGTRTSQFALR